MNTVRITNTLTGNKEIFNPLHDAQVSLYVCGITPYDYAHIGHGRVYVVFDVLYRLLSFLGYSVTYIRNFTDIDDKLIARAHKELGFAQKYMVIADRYIVSFNEDMEQLGCVAPTKQPRVTDHIPEIIAFIEGLIAQGIAYVVDGDVYFEVARFSHYCKLSRHKLEDLKAGDRVEIDARKKNPLDFALWKSEKEGTFWRSPWGYGRPGWHIECSVLATHYLGKTIDIHGGGMDLIFPHHDNEIAQSEALYQVPFVRYWVHNAFVRINKEKMSKSLGNFFTLRDLFKQFDPMVVRYYYLMHHYRSPIDFSFDALQAVEKSYRRLAAVFEGVSLAAMDSARCQQSPIVQKMLTFITDDSNISGLLGVVHEESGALNNSPDDAAAVAYFFHTVLGLSLRPVVQEQVITPEIQALIDEREQARVAKDWARADALRDQLRNFGFEPQDTKVS